MSKVVVFVHGGKVQNVMVDDEFTEVLVIDSDVDEVPANEQVTATHLEPEDADVSEVEEFENKWQALRYCLNRCREVQVNGMLEAVELHEEMHERFKYERRLP